MTAALPDGDLGLLSPVSAAPRVTALTGDRAVLAAILRVEAAWAGVLEEASLAPAGSSAVVAAAADVDRYDLAGIAVRAQGGANPVIPLLADLRAQVTTLDTEGLGASAAVHASLTSQDVLDSALMLLASDAVAELLAEVRESTAALAGLAERHRDTVCVGRSLTQHSLPYSFGLRAAQWFAGLADAGTAGPAVTPFELSDRLAASLGLDPVPAPWHTNRLAVTALGDALTAVTDAAGKIAGDVLFLSRPEVAELSEPVAPGRGGSSAMPHKQNPVLSVLVRSAALQAPALAAQLHLAAASFNDERADGAWHAEWPALRSLLRLALGAAGQLRELTAGLQVHPDAMRRNLDLFGPLLLSEAVGAAVAPLLGDGGRARLQEVVDRTLQAPAAERGATYRSLLREAVPADALTDERLEELLDPANYLGQSGGIIRRLLDARPGFADPALQKGVSDD